MINENLESLLVLSGECLKSFPRSRTAVQVYTLYDLKGTNLPIVVSGKGPGMKIPESVFMRDYLLSQGVREQDIFTEEESLDTFANFVYSTEILKQLGVQRIGLITEPFHIPRALSLGEKVLGEKYRLIPIPSHGRKFTPFSRIKEKIAEKTLLWDLRKIKEGDIEAFKEYLRTSHSYGENPSGIYKWFFESYHLFK